MAKRYAKLHAGMVKRTVAKPAKIILPDGKVVDGWAIVDEAA